MSLEASQDRRRHPDARHGGSEAGQVTVLTIGFTAVLLGLVVVVVAVTTVLIQARKVQSLADGAALAGAEELGFQLDQDPSVVLDPAAVEASVQEYLVDVGARESVPGLTAVRSEVSADRTTVVVRIDAAVSLVPTGGWLAGAMPAAVPVTAEGGSRTALTR